MSGAAPHLPEALDILLVESDPLEAELLAYSLRQTAPERCFGIAGDGEEALDYLLGRGRYRQRFGAPMPKLTLLAAKLPKADGLEVLQALRGNPRGSSAPVVMLMTARDSRELAQAYHLGANSCVQKPVDFEACHRLIETIARYWLELNEPPAPASTLA